MSLSLVLIGFYIFSSIVEFHNDYDQIFSAICFVLNFYCGKGLTILL